jgi:hypothetical protein
VSDIFLGRRSSSSAFRSEGGGLCCRKRDIEENGKRIALDRDMRDEGATGRAVPSVARIKTRARTASFIMGGSSRFEVTSYACEVKSEARLQFVVLVSGMILMEK